MHNREPNPNPQALNEVHSKALKSNYHSKLMAVHREMVNGAGCVEARVNVLSFMVFKTLALNRTTFRVEEE